MAEIYRWIRMCFICLVPIASWANPIRESANDWQCQANDSTDKQWLGKGSYQRVAINNALEACKTESPFPISCRVSKEACEVFINGVSTSPMWRCTALDEQAKIWRSAIYTHRDDAALGAKAYCQEHSAMPDTCYINLMMCKNLAPKWRNDD